jgi:hypothetical protein
MRARGTRFAFVLTACAVVPLACNSISGLDADYRLAENGVPTAGGDGRGVPHDGGGGEGASERDAQLDGTVEDVAPDAPDAPIDSSKPLECPSPLPSNVLWCDDFEAVKSAPLYGWSRSQNIGGNPSVEPGVGFGGTRGLHAMPTGPCTQFQSCAVVLWRTVQNGFASGSLKLSLRFQVKSAGIDYAVIGAIQFNSREYGLAVYKNAVCPGGGVCLDENQPTGSHDFGGAIAITPGDRWYYAEITLTRSGSSFAGTVFVDGTKLNEVVAGAMPSTPEPTTIEIGVGAFFTGQNGQSNVFVDGVEVVRGP